MRGKSAIAAWLAAVLALSLGPVVAWSTEIGSRVDDILSGKVETIPGEQVFAELAARRVARQAARNE